MIVQGVTRARLLLGKLSNSKAFAVAVLAAHIIAVISALAVLGVRICPFCR